MKKCMLCIKIYFESHFSILIDLYYFSNRVYKFLVVQIFMVCFQFSDNSRVERSSHGVALFNFFRAALLCEHRFNDWLARSAAGRLSVREIQGLLAHKHLETTMIYTFVLQHISDAPQSPLDALFNQKISA